MVDTRLDVDAALLVWVMHGQVVCWCRDWPSSKEVDLELMGEREGYPDKHRSVTGRRARSLGQGGGRAGHPLRVWPPPSRYVAKPLSCVVLTCTGGSRRGCC